MYFQGRSFLSVVGSLRGCFKIDVIIRGGGMLGCCFAKGFERTSNVSCTLEMLRESVHFGCRQSSRGRVVCVE